jgi:hypothetical protein
MRRLALAAAPALVMAVVTPVVADELVTQRWPEVPADNAPSMEDQITDHLSEMVSDRFTNDVTSLHVDGRHNRARFGIRRNGAGHYLTFRLDSNWLFEHGQAHVDATLELGLGTHHLEVKLPPMDIIPDNWHGQDLVVVDLNLIKRQF